MTYSIVAFDPVTGELGAAVQSRWFAAGAVVPWLRPGVGAIASQSFADPRYGYEGIELLAGGLAPETVLERLVAADPSPAVRQVGIVDARGHTAAWTGDRCVEAAGHLTAENVSVQANMMERATVWPAMLAAYATAEGDLADRLLAALRAAEGEGGDVRGRQAAGLVIVPGGPDRPPWTTRFDVRIDDSPTPLDELARLLRVARAYEAYGDASDAAAAGRIEEALPLIAKAAALAPDDDQIRLWQALFVFAAGDEARGRDLYRSAAAAEPRAPEHLRRFAAAGHLPGLEDVVARLIGT